MLKESVLKESHLKQSVLKDWPELERPREKLLHLGSSSLSDAELLAIFLRTGVKGCHVVDLARKLLSSFGSLGAVFSASQEDFCARHGLGKAKYVQLQACLEMSKRYLAEKIRETDCSLTSSQATRDYLLSELRFENREIFAVLFLDNQHQVLTFERLFFGTLDAAAVYPRVVVEQAIKHHAAAVILTHNHPSGVAEASIADKQITDKLMQALQLIDVRVLDHIIVAGHQCYSFAEHGEMTN
ncbi:RadC family protein [Colwellia psychrerythraea]|uniref:DNA repair protein RadC n=1 Tax=Colwellia psychrerythraea TaxID=28229 RepID=A0A099L3N7_COLPS|nr:DNA repair protein RadC [Colwellia psychrerythraea]KGJ97476.1 DNA repair protein RadC [Colwellia psychrerythraea]